MHVNKTDIRPCINEFLTVFQWGRVYNLDD